MAFIPDDDPTDLKIPYFEDSNNNYGIQGHGTTKSESQLLSEISGALGRLEGMFIRAATGRFEEEGHPVRHGYIIYFTYKGIPGEIKVAGLPLRGKATEARIQKTKNMALYNIRNTLEAQFMMRLLSPGSIPLLQHLRLAGGKSVADYISDNFLALEAPADPDLIEGELVK